MQRSPSFKLFPDADWPADREMVRFIEKSPADSLSRQDFVALWWEGERRRGQFFRAKLAEHVRRARSEGATVKVVELGSDEKAAA